jgi:hypothetical protein
MDRVIERLLNSDEPSVRFKVLVKVLGHDADTAVCQQLRQEIKTSPRTQLLLSGWNIGNDMPPGPYRKWSGAHWVLADLADIGYPPGDGTLIPLRECVYRWLFGQSHQQQIRTIKGRTRRCASQ